MIARKVAESARQDQISRVDITYFEKAAAFWQCKLSGEDLLIWHHWEQHFLQGPSLSPA